MNQNLQKIVDFLQNTQQLSVEDKISLAKAVKDAESVIAITASKLDRTEKVKRTTAILLEETIEELGQKQKAVEAQNRELEIESSLERVRAVALSMQNPSEMLEVCRNISKQLEFLKVKDIRNVQTAVIDEKKGTYLNYEYYSRHDKQLATEVSYKTHPLQEEFATRMLKGAGEFFHTSLLGQEVRDWYEYQKTTNQFADSFLEEAKTLNYYIFSLGPVSLGISTYWPLVEEEINLFKRFRNVFELTYRRFLDIQKAEAQAHEAQIQLALERVRARTMAMQKSEELSETVAVLFHQFHTLGESPERIAIEIVNEKDKVFEIWATRHGGSQMDQLFKASLDEPYVMQKMYTAWKEQTKSITIDLQGRELEEYYQYLKKEGLPVQREIFGKRRVQNVATFSKGILTIITPETKPQETIDLLERFATVFDGTYTRFLDLQKAESQAREAQVEASLERVRSKTMAMHNSLEVGETVVTLFDELVILGLRELDRCGIGIMHEPYIMEAWTASKKDAAQLVIGHIDMNLHPLLQGTYEGWKNKKESFQYILEGEDKLKYFHIINNQPDYRAQRDIASLPVRVVLTDFYFSEGCLYAFSAKELSAETAKIFTRVAGVFGQTYRRYLDLQKAEAQAKEAIKASSLDRVRAEIASMRTVDDLQRITPLIWHELIALDVPFVRCGVFIVNEATNHVQVFLSAPDGHSLAALDLPFGSSKLTNNSVTNWRKGLIYKTHWNKEEFMDWMHAMVRDGQVQNTETYQGATTPPESLDLHFVPFAQGMLYVGNLLPLTNGELDLVKSLAEAFSIAFARYEDFKKLEIAKQSIETTLSDLKSAQSQLVQSEKMASLGELTAGIAHEIQNPLNFVNNFSEVSTELVDEMNEEINNGNIEAAKELAENLRQNLLKISHHGKRAGDIVKGMLQHSRTSYGVKEPTDINTLIDEYLRLAYHGIRAKDKSFNSRMKTYFDETIGKIDLVPQDMGRVILNLITNAFYAVDAKKNASASSSTGQFEPTVSVTTKKEGNKILISVQDNGDGIPEQIRDKIFQPFFTTKPTGEGTGLGLSLSYDIVKAQGGELKVETKEGEGSEFIIQLPV